MTVAAAIAREVRREVLRRTLRYLVNDLGSMSAATQGLYNTIGSAEDEGLLPEILVAPAVMRQQLNRVNELVDLVDELVKTEVQLSPPRPPKSTERTGVS